MRQIEDLGGGGLSSHPPPLTFKGVLLLYIYTVKPGDSLYSIARQFGVAAGELIRQNMLPFSDRLAVGQTVVVNTPDKYTVNPGDSLYSIALKNDSTLDSLLAANSTIRPPYLIRPGQTINLPPPQKTDISVLGYARPSISPETLALSLPYLTYLGIFSASVDQNGNLSSINDASMISQAKNSKVAPLLVVTNVSEGGGFNSDLVGQLLNNEAATDNLISNLVSVCEQKGYFGVNIDFEYIYPRDRVAYNTFLSKLSEEFAERDLLLSTALAPKQSATQVGTLYEAHDYAFHGAVADFVVLMTYEWGYTYGPPLAVAPYNQVKKVISYATTEMPASKILMGMPNYAYDWTLPFVQGTAARAMTVNNATRLAVETGSEIQFSEESKAPFFEYTKDGKRHIVWFEDARSTAARLSLIKDFGLGGAAYWTIGSFFAQNWLVLSSMFNVKKVL